MNKPKFRRSLLFRYLIIIVFAFLFIPFIFPIVSLLYFLTHSFIGINEQETLKYGSFAQLESSWHEEAASMDGWSNDRINEKLQELKEKYPDGKLFWVDAQGNTQLQLPHQNSLPMKWTQAEAIRFMKQNVNSDPFTVISFTGSQHDEASFIVIQMPRNLMVKTVSQYEFPFLSVVLIILGCFAALSLLFFRHMRKRLLQLEAAMSIKGANGLPTPVLVRKQDEIGQLEAAFNRMIEQLQSGLLREAEEESLRKQLIANLSHDLRTPLTVMNGHIYNLRKEAISPSGQLSIQQLEGKIADMSRLIDNLLSYTLMTSGRYPLKLEQHDMLRLVRESAAAWYPLWEKEGLTANIQLDTMPYPMVWTVDKDAFRRVLDNLFQNVVRHAKQGGYISVSVENRKGAAALVIADAGGGMDSQSDNKGSGIGLAIAKFLTREMGLAVEIVSTTHGVSVYIYPFLNEI